jgi:hypothetical protein
MHGLRELHRLADRFRARGLRHALAAKQTTNEQEANGGSGNDANTRHCIPPYTKRDLIGADRNDLKVTQSRIFWRKAWTKTRRP